MKLIPTEEAVGHVLCHDITRIVKDECKGPAFRKGHIVTESDIAELLKLGKEHLYVWEKKEGWLHEDEGAEILYQLCANDYMRKSETKEGKIEIFSEIDGLLKVDKERLKAVNLLGDVMISTRHGNFPVKKGDKLAGMRVIPLIIEEERMNQAKAAAGAEPLMEVLPFKKKKVGIVTTGSEVYHGRIKDTFGPVIREKFSEYPSEILGQAIVDDNSEMIQNAIREYLNQGADIVVCTGGMSVDPDDLTPGAIGKVADRVISYGAPVLPGAMFLLAYTPEAQPLAGLPGCVMYAKRTIFDLILPRLMADDAVTAEELAELGHGGLCLDCAQCTFPNCGFGK
ncbi:MAG: molybdopterin-binding protein [Clostridia bacterium]|nr:molybdopterin-binding protein [Lachnospiraceae bacterium]NCB99843.1 molybdopterin-binding protein [Clostridia bacterium]NCD02782.1 molybdopterin-binding protein [Clostridia bacterium]